MTGWESIPTQPGKNVGPEAETRVWVQPLGACFLTRDTANTPFHTAVLLTPCSAPEQH